MNIFYRYNAWILSAILIFSAGLSLLVARNDSAVFDERAHIPAAYSYVRYQDMRLNPEHPPLLKDLAGLPLLFLKPTFPVTSSLWQEGVNEQWSLGTEFIYKNNADIILFLSRLPNILIGLFLGFFIYRWTKELTGPVAGLFATLLYAFNPSMLAHSHYVTFDIGVTAFIFIAVYVFVRFLKEPSKKNIIFLGLALGLAELTKFSAFILFPYFGLLVFLYSLTKNEPNLKATSILHYLAKYLGSVAISFALIWVIYALNTANMPAEKTIATANNVFQNSPPIEAFAFAKKIVVGLARTPFLASLGHYFLGLSMSLSRVEGGNTFYFLGKVSTQASYLYFPFVFLTKETLPFLLLFISAIIISLIGVVRKICNKKIYEIFPAFRQFFRDNIDACSMLGFVVLYGYISITSNLNIGFRHLFPILPFLYVLTTKNIFNFVDFENIKMKRGLHFVIAAFVVWIVSIPLVAFPGYLSYFNELVGSNNGYKYVTDSNYDWGQDLKRLRIFVDNYNQCLKEKYLSGCSLSAVEPINTIRINYFGGSEPSYYFRPGEYKDWHSEMAPEVGWYAVSVTFLQEGLYKPNPSGAYNYYVSVLKKYQPVARAGESIFIYYVPSTD